MRKPLTVPNPISFFHKGRTAVPTPHDLRQQAYRFLKAAKSELNKDSKRWLAGHAFMLAQLAETAERSAATADQTDLVRADDETRAGIPERARTETLGQMLIAAALPACQLGASMIF